MGARIRLNDFGNHIKGTKMSVYRSKDQQWSLVTHRYTKLQQGHADDIIGAVGIADRERLGLRRKVLESFSRLF